MNSPSRPKHVVPNNSTEVLAQGHQQQGIIHEDISIEDPTNEAVQPVGNPYQREQNDNAQNAQNVNPQHPQIIQNGNAIIINGAPPNVVIINEQQAAKPDPIWTREERIGCCCVSVDNQSWCCNIFCMDSCCRCIQHSNLCCYCHDHDCIYCCVHTACRVCCFQKEMCECMLECCKHMPICLLAECLKNSGCCQAICGCLQNCNICQILQGCNCDCAGHIIGAICEILCCFFK